MRRGISWLVGLSILCSGIVLLALPPPAGAGLVSRSEEIEIGREAVRQLASRYRFTTDKRLEATGRRLVRASGRPDLRCTFKIIESDEVNAVSLPGGHIYLYRGLMRQLGDDEDALAGVLAHEISHVSERHAVRQVEKEMGANLLLELLNRGKMPKAGPIVTKLLSLRFGRDDEEQADQMAVGYMERAGYDPRGLVRFLKRLEEPEGRGRGLTWLRSHPGTADRVRRVEDLVESLRLHRSLR
jgi:predicted Zn-dependent protease